MDIEMKTILTEILGKLDSIDGRMDGLESRMNHLEADVSHIKADLSEVKSDVSELKVDVKANYQELLTLDQRTEKLAADHQKVSSMQTDIDILKHMVLNHIAAS